MLTPEEARAQHTGASRLATRLLNYMNEYPHTKIDERHVCEALVQVGEEILVELLPPKEKK